MLLLRSPATKFLQRGSVARRKRGSNQLLTCPRHLSPSGLFSALPAPDVRALPLRSCGALHKLGGSTTPKILSETISPTHSCPRNRHPWVCATTSWASRPINFQTRTSASTLATTCARNLSCNANPKHSRRRFLRKCGQLWSTGT